MLDNLCDDRQCVFSQDKCPKHQFDGEGEDDDQSNIGKCKILVKRPSALSGIWNLAFKSPQNILKFHDAKLSEISNFLVVILKPNS